MATIVTRAGKGSPLTHDEVDDNFSNLNTDKLETSGDGSGLTNIARKVWESSQGSGSSANYWAKVATYSITGDFDDGTFIYHFMPEELGAGMPAIIAVNVRTNNASGGDSHTLNVELMSKPHATPFSDDSFKLIDNGGSSDIELWVKKNDNNCQISAYEMSAHVEDSGFTIAYNQNAAWQSSEPTGTGLNIKTAGVKVAGNFTATAFAGDGSALTGLATAAQGTLADSAVQPNDSPTFGSIIATGAAASYTDTGLYLQNKGSSVFDVGAWRSGASVAELTFSTDSGSDAAPVEAMRIDSAGRVGIGTTNPSSNLAVIGGDTNAVSIGSDGHVQLYDTPTSSRSHTFLSRDISESMVGGNMRLDESVTTGSHVGYSNGTNARGGSGIVFENTTGGASAYGEIKFLQSNDTNDDTWVVREAMQIDTSGRVGIGKTNPATPLDVTGTVTATAFAGDGSALTGIAAGATGGGNDDIFYENGQNVTTNYTITNGKNAMSAGPITVDSGVTVTVGAGETWTVV